MKKARKGKRILAALGGLVFFALFLWWFNSFTLQTTKIEIASPKIQNEIRFVQLTDLHGASFGIGNKKLIRRIRRQKPEFVAVTGDMYTSGSARGRKTALALLCDLAKKYPVYYINGEHDNSDSFCEALTQGGVKVLNYEEDILRIGETTLHLYGINNLHYTTTFDLRNAFVPDEESFTLLLSHASNFRKFADFGIDLSLSGDTHGGLARLPFAGALYNQGTWLPEHAAGVDADVRYTKGLYQKGESRLFVSSGLGNYPLPLRLCNRPEVVAVKLVPVEN